MGLELSQAFNPARVRRVVETLTAGASWTAPAKLHGGSVIARVWGPGGNGAAGAAPPPADSGGGGGPGGFAEGRFSAAPSQAFPIRIGTNAGGLSTFFSTAAALFGNPGGNAAGLVGGAAGTSGGTAAHTAITGSDGNNGNNSLLIGVIAITAPGGIGGMSPRGGGGGRGGETAPLGAHNGTPGKRPGGGGGGGNSSTLAAGTGAAGADGMIEVEYLLNV